MPGPRKEDTLVRLALSKEDLKISLMPRLSARALKEGYGKWVNNE
jgi:hypothetical protein